MGQTEKDYMLKEIWELNGIIECISGLSIGGADATLSIGGVDSEVIKNPITNLPYIPGSSIKGKMRCMLERIMGSKHLVKDKNNQNANKSKKTLQYAENTSGDPCGCGKNDCIVCSLFGAYQNVESFAGTPRIIVRDAVLTEKIQDEISRNSIDENPYLETKMENIINRNTGSVNYKSGARTIERVTAGTEFDFKIILQIYNSDNEEKVTKYKETIKKALDLIELSYLGGSGSRGYGQVKFKEQKWHKIFDVNN